MMSKLSVRLSIAFLTLLALAGAVTWGAVKLLTPGGSAVLQATSVDGKPLTLFSPRPLGDSFEQPPRISYVEIVDLDQDGRFDVLVCDCTKDLVSWIRQTTAGEFEEHVLAADVPAPARVECVDFDGDGDLDIFVAILGRLFPTNDKVGSLMALENDGQQNFSQRMLLDQVARVSDVRAGDLDQDGDLDLAITQFGYNDGETRWLENQGNWKFSSHILQQLAGGIHSIIADFDGDSLPDIAVLISQEIESVFIFYGLGGGEFDEHKVYSAENPDFGSAGIWVEDLDQDGDLDLLYCNGDAFDYSPPRPWPWHGAQWLENMDGHQFRYHRLVDFGGAVNACAHDYDRDGDVDIFLTSAFNDWDSPASQSLRLLKNAGSMQFHSHPLANSPSHIQAIDIADMDGDGTLDLVTGGMHVSEPYDRIGRVTLWVGMPGAQVPASEL